MISLADFTKRPNSALTKKQILQVQKWLDADWESCDIDREVIILIKRLLRTIQYPRRK